MQNNACLRTRSVTGLKVNPSIGVNQQMAVIDGVSLSLAYVNSVGYCVLLNTVVRIRHIGLRFI